MNTHASYDDPDQLLCDLGSSCCALVIGICSNMLLAVCFNSSMGPITSRNCGLNPYSAHISTSARNRLFTCLRVARAKGRKMVSGYSLLTKSTCEGMGPSAMTRMRQCLSFSVVNSS